MKGQSSKPQMYLYNTRSHLTPLELLDFCQLPAHLQQIIVITAAVTLRRSGESFGIVYAALAPVCKDWREMVRDEQLMKEINQQAIFQDPMCRYLRTAQRVPIVGFQNNEYIGCIFSVGDILYVTECPDLDLPLRVFIYDIDDTKVRHEKPSRRNITLSNRRPLAIVGLIGNVALLVPKSDFLYAIECDDDGEAEVIIHKLLPDGTVLLRCNTHSLANTVDTIIFETPNDFIALITVIDDDRYVCGYSTVTGARVGKGELATWDETKRGNDSWRTGAGSDTPIFISNKPCYMLCDRAVLTFDGYGCLLYMSQSNLMFIDTTSCSWRDRVRARELRSPNARRFASNFHWFDKTRDLIFCSHMKTLRVLRITH